MNGAKKHRWILTLVFSLLTVGIFWMGIYVGHVGERNRTRGILNKMAQNVEHNSIDVEAYAKELAALENYLANSDKLLLTISYIRNMYVDHIAMDSLYDRVIPLLLSELDPHSEYISARYFSEVNESLEGEFDGIGIVFNALTDTITVLNVIPQGPSDKAGVRPGDRILLIDDRSVAGQGIPQDSMMKLMRGPRGSHVKLSVERSGIDRLVDIDVERDAIEINSIETAFMLDKSAGVGFVRLSQFARTSHEELVEAIAKLEEEGLQSLIIDLRGNGGGYLDQAILITNEFLPANKLIVYTEDRYGLQQREYSRGFGGSTELPLAILVDESSASASEILAGAIQDNDRGLVIGRRTFGKGLVQAQLPFVDGSALRLTVARYYTPTGRSIQKPYTPGDGLGYYMEILDRYNHNEFFSADSIHFDESMKFTTPGGRTVYGGGGIMPDIFMPLDTLGITPYYNEVWNSNVLYRYTMDFTDRHREELSAAKSLDDLDRILGSTDLIKEFTAYAERNGVATNSEELATSHDIILAQIRAYISRNALNDEAGFYYNIYPIDATLQRAVEELRRQTAK